MNETAVVVKKGKKPANQTQSHTETLNLVQAETCNAFLQAIRSLKDTPDGLMPAMADRMDSLEVSIEDGLITAMINENPVSGYEVITWIIFGSITKGINYVMVGALVIVGIQKLNMFEQLTGFDQDDPDNVVLRTMKIVNVAEALYQNDLGRSAKLAPEPDSALQVDHVRDDIATAQSVDPALEGAPIDIGEEPAEPADDIDLDAQKSSAVEKELVRISNIISAEGLNTPDVPEAKIPTWSEENQNTGDSNSGEFSEDSIVRPDGHVIDGDINVQEPNACKDDNDDQIAEIDLPAVLKAFNEKVPSEAECLRQFQRHTHSLFCTEIRIGRRLVQKKQELKSPALYLKWRRETFSDPKFDNKRMSRCTHYGLFEKSLKSKRGGFLKDNDIRLCSQKAMQAIGGYKSKNADDLLNEVVSRLDRGEYLSADSVSHLVREFKAKVTKPKRDEEETPPPVPRTIQELFELPEKWLSRAGKKHMAEFQELLEALEPEIQSRTAEAAVVLPLVKIFTVM